MKQPPNHFLSLGILTAAILAAVLGMLVSNSQAQSAGKGAAQPAGKAAPETGTAARTGDNTVAKPKPDGPKTEKPLVVKGSPSAAKEPKPAVVVPPAVTDPDKAVPKVAAEKETPVVAPKFPAKSHPASNRKQGLMAGLTIFVLAVFVGFDVINRVPTTLHTPLMSGSNAISGITVVGALIAAGQGFHFSSFLGFFAVALAMINVVGGFLVTHRMLLMFRRK